MIGKYIVQLPLDVVRIAIKRQHPLCQWMLVMQQICANCVRQSATDVECLRMTTAKSVQQNARAARTNVK